jgi:hypothetical protein
MPPVVAASESTEGPKRQQQQQQQEEQQKLVAGLLDMLIQKYSPKFDLSWGLGSVAPLAVLEVDWGLDCLQHKLDWCNGKLRERSADRCVWYVCMHTFCMEIMLWYVDTCAAVYTLCVALSNGEQGTLSTPPCGVHGMH